MSRTKIILIVLGGVAVLGLIILLWFLFFGRGGTSTPNNTGSFGTGGDVNRAPGTGEGVAGNIQTPLPTGPTTGQGGSYNAYRPSHVPSSPSTPNSGTTNSDTTTNSSSNDVTWIIPGSSTNLGGGKVFTPTPINTVNNINISGTAYFQKSTSGGGGSGGATDPLTGQLIACTAQFLTGAANGAIASAFGSVLAVTVNAPVQNMKDADTLMKDFLACIARTIARAILGKITSNVVDWLNSGFGGNPAFVQDFEQFFTDAADQAIGKFIQGNDFSFLCSPIQGPVRVAIAKSYARSRGSGGSGGSPNSCSMGGGNLDSFINGDFSQGGWDSLLSYTTVPNNNAFGAYMYEEDQLNRVGVQAAQLANRKVTPGGYLPVANNQGSIQTPAGTVESVANYQLQVPQEMLIAAKNFDEVIAALLTELVDRLIYQGLAKLSGQNGYASNFTGGTEVDQQATDAAQALLLSLKNAIQAASQYGGVEQGSVADIQNAQLQLQDLANCWGIIASSTNSTQAMQQAAAANGQIQTLEIKIAAYNNEITRANKAMVQVQQFQTRALAATTIANINAIQSDLNLAKASGTLFTAADVVGAQQDRTTLQAQMSTINIDTGAKLNQCHAFQG